MLKRIATRRLQFSLFGLLTVTVLAAVIFAIAGVPIRQAERDRAWRSHLRQIGIALHAYHDANDSFPPAYVADESGQPMHSWRVLILPYLDDPRAQDIYNRYDFDEPWDGPHNRRLINEVPDAYRDPIHPAPGAFTKYMVISGPDALFDGAAKRRFRDVWDGTANTIMVVEVASSSTIWSEPADLELGKLRMQINATHDGTSISNSRRDGAYALHADGAVYLYPNDFDAPSLRQLIDPDDGQSTDMSPLR